MAWAFPRFAFNDGDVVDSDKLNDTVLRFVVEAAQTNESNWSSGVMTQLKADEKIADDIGATFHTDRNNGHTGANPFATANALDIVRTSSWAKVPSTTSTIRTRGGMCLVSVCFQFHGLDNVSQPGTQFCIGVDEQPRTESLIGSGEMSNNTSVRPSIRYPSPSTATSRTPAANPADVAATFRGTGPAISSERLGLSMQLVTYLEPGVHTIDLRARNVAHHNGDWDQYITQCEFTILDIWADPR